jgi:hypothetical protein
MKCEHEEELQYLFLFTLTPISCIAWGIIGAIYLVDAKLSIPPGALIAAEAFSHLLSLLTTIGYWPVLHR